MITQISAEVNLKTKENLQSIRVVPTEFSLWLLLLILVLVLVELVLPQQQQQQLLLLQILTTIMVIIKWCWIILNQHRQIQIPPLWVTYNQQMYNSSSNKILLNHNQNKYQQTQLKTSNDFLHFFPLLQK